MHDSSPLAGAAFIGWNSFQIAHYGPLLERCERPTLVVPSDNSTAETPTLQDAFSREYDGSSFEIPRARLHLLDGRFRYLFSQTALKLSRPIEETLLFSVQYSLTKERHQYGPWHAEFDASFVYGPHAKEQVEYFCPAFQVGHLRLAAARKRHGHSASGSPELSSSLDPDKPTILYAPTWGLLSSLDEFLPQISSLRERYNVLVRPHHNSMSRELHRLGAVPVDAGTGVLDSSAPQILAADVVVTDYSGFAFDALFLDRPVVLFRPDHETKLGVENLTPTSLEVVAAASIGPVTTSPAELERALSDATNPNVVPATSTQDREALLARCFSDVDDPARAIVSTIRELERRGRPSRRPQQLWVRDLLMSRARANRSRGRKRKRGATKKERSARRQSGSRTKSLAQAILLQHRSLYVVSIAATAALAKDERHRHLLAKLDEVGAVRTASALAMPRALLRRQVTHGLSRVLTRRPGASSDSERANRLVRISQFDRNHVGDSLRLSVLASNHQWASRLHEEAVLNLAGSDDSTAIRALRTLMLLRCLRAVDEAFTQRPALIGARGGASVLKRLTDAQERVRGIDAFADQASRNELTPSSSDMEPLEPAPRSTADFKNNWVHVFLPPHFYAQWDQLRGGRRARNWLEVRDIYTNLLESLSEDGHFAVVPRQQYFMNTVPPSHDETLLSFFTKGGGSGNWHIKDAGTLGLISVDPYGFNGSSVFSQTPLELLNQLVHSAEPDLALLRSLEAFFDRAGGDKYAFPTTATAPAATGSYVFVPLQSTRGIEEASVPVDRLVPLICKAAARLGLQVVFKRHPLCVDPLISTALDRAQQADWVHTSTGDTWRLVQDADAVVTVNSGVVFQALVAEKPLVTLGPSDVGAVAFRGHWRNVLDPLHAALEGPVDVEKYRRFLAIYYGRYLIDPMNHQAVGQRVRLAAELSGRYPREPAKVAESYVRSLQGKSSRVERDSQVT